MWNMKRRHSFHSCKTAAAEAAVKADRREPRQRSERSGEPLRTTGAEAIARQRDGTLAAPQQTHPERSQLDKELISSPRELNSSRPGMEYLSHSGAKRRLPAAPATRTPAHGPHAAMSLCFQHVNAAATGIGTAAHNCFRFNGCHIATRKPLIF